MHSLYCCGSDNHLWKIISRLKTLLLSVRIFTTVGLSIMSSRIATASWRQIHRHSCVSCVQSETLIIEAVVLWYMMMDLLLRLHLYLVCGRGDIETRSILDATIFSFINNRWREEAIIVSGCLLTITLWRSLSPAYCCILKVLIVFLRILWGGRLVIDYHLPRLILQLNLSAIIMQGLVVISAYVLHHRLTLVYDNIIHIWSRHHLWCTARVIIRAFTGQMAVDTRRSTRKMHSRLWIEAVVRTQIMQPLLKVLLGGRSAMSHLIDKLWCIVLQVLYAQAKVLTGISIRRHIDWLWMLYGCWLRG